MTSEWPSPPNSSATRPAPSPQPQRTTDYDVRCGCGALLARAVTRPWSIDCRKCKARNERS